MHRKGARAVRRRGVEKVHQEWSNSSAPYPTFQTVIPRNTAIKEAQIKKTDIFSYDEKAYAAIAYENLLSELFV